MEALGYPAGEPEVLLGQLVKLVRGGEPVRLSKRAGNVITLADILDEVDPDVARLTFLLQSIDTTQTFDLDVVTAQSMENPVYYVQYAHARIASIGRRAAELGVTRRPILDVVARAAHARARARAAARARGVSRRGRRGRRAAGAAPRHHVGARLRQVVPRLLPRLPRDHRRRRAHAGPAVARRGLPARPRRRARRSSASTRPTRWPASPTSRSRERRRPDRRRSDPGPRSTPPAAAHRRGRRRPPRVGGCDVAGLAETFGTPLYVYDEDELRARCREYADAFGDDAVAYAAKAFLCVAMARLVADEGLHLDVATGGELHVARRAGFPPARIVFHGNNKSEDELRSRSSWASGASSSTPSTSSIASRRSSPTAVPRPGAGPRHPGCRGAHPRVHRHRRRRLEVRLHRLERRRA